MWGHFSQADTEPPVHPPTSATPHHCHCLIIPGPPKDIHKQPSEQVAVPAKVPQVDSTLIPGPSCHSGGSHSHLTTGDTRLTSFTELMRLQPSNSKFRSESTQKAPASAPPAQAQQTQRSSACITPTWAQIFPSVSFCLSLPLLPPPPRPLKVPFLTFIGHRCRAYDLRPREAVGCRYYLLFLLPWSQGSPSRPRGHRVAWSHSHRTWSQEPFSLLSRLKPLIPYTFPLNPSWGKEVGHKLAYFTDAERLAAMRASGCIPALGCRLPHQHTSSLPLPTPLPAPRPPGTLAVRNTGIPHWCLPGWLSGDGQSGAFIN